MVIAIPIGTSIYVARDATDLRKAFDGLCNLARFGFGLDPFGGALFVFFNRRGDRVKILQWDGNGFWLHTKRLERGTFERWQPISDGAGHIEIDRAEFMMLLEGVDLKRVKFRRHFARQIRITRSGQHDSKSQQQDDAGRREQAR